MVTLNRDDMISGLREVVTPRSARVWLKVSGAYFHGGG